MGRALALLCCVLGFGWDRGVLVFGCEEDNLSLGGISHRAFLVYAVRSTPYTYGVIVCRA